VPSMGQNLLPEKR